MISTPYPWIKHVARTSGIIGLAVALMGFPATCTGPNQALFNSMNETELAIHDDSGQANTVSKPKTWTVYCEREDGAKSKFTVSSELADHINPSLEENPLQDSLKDLESGDAKEIVLDASSQNADPFGESSVKCGKLLTLLAIFATIHKQHP